jgi:signal transduction histidine kinase
MKFLVSPSLFPFLLGIVISLMNISSVFSQQKIDSTSIYGNIIMNPHHDSDISAAFNYYERMVVADLKRGDTLDAVNKLRTISIGQIEMGAVYESEATAIKAMNLLDKLPDNPDTKSAKKGVYSDLGKVYRTLHSPANAIRYYDKGLELCENAFDSLIMFNNKGNVFTDAKNYSLAQKEFLVAYDKSLTLSDSLIQARVLDNLGFARSKARDPGALENMLKALQIRLRKVDLAGTYSSYRHLALHHLDREQKEEALEYAEKAYDVALEINSPSYLENALSNLLRINDDPHAKHYIGLSDSIQRAKLTMQNKYAGMQYNIAKEKEKTEANRLLQEEEKRRRQAYQFLGLFSILALVAYYFIQKVISKKETLQQIYLTETRISKKVHDEVANDVYHLMNKIQLNTHDNEALLDDLDDIYKKTRDISRENSELIIKEDFTQQLKDLIHSYNQPGTVITIQSISKINWNKSSEIKKTSIYRILQELMTNMKKHSKATQVLLSFEHSKNKIRIGYFDNGVGCDLNNKHGLQNMENRIKAVEGSITFETELNKGFRVTIII